MNSVTFTNLLANLYFSGFYIKSIFLLIAILQLIRLQLVTHKTPCIYENFSIWYLYSFFACYIATITITTFIEKIPFPFVFVFSKYILTILFLGSLTILQNILTKVLTKELHIDFTSRTAMQTFNLRNFITKSCDFLSLLVIYFLAIFACFSPVLIEFPNSLFRAVIMAFCTLQILILIIIHFTIKHLRETFKRKIVSKKCQKFLRKYSLYIASIFLYLLLSLVLQKVLTDFSFQGRQVYINFLRNISTVLWLFQSTTMIVMAFDFRKFLYD